MQKLLKSMADVEIVKDSGDPNDLIGYGALSQVRKCKHKSTGKFYALKEMDLKQIHPNDIKNITREVRTHIFLDHPNIVKLYDHYTDPKNVLYLLLEYCDNNNLFHFIQKSRIDEKVIHKFFYQTVQAIEYIHKRKIMHRDLKPENILLDKNFNVKVCDFGWCAEYNENERRQTFCGTNEYMAPEIVDSKSQDFGIDIWALGILLYEMYHKRAPFTGRSPQDIMKAIKERRLVFKANPMCKEAQDIIDKILQIDPKKRLTIEQIYAHPYFHKFPFFRLMTNDSKTIAAKNTRSSYVGGEEGRELMNTLGKKVRAPSPGRSNGLTMTDSKLSGTQPIKITSYKDAMMVSAQLQANGLAGGSNLQSSSTLNESRPKAFTTIGPAGTMTIAPLTISSAGIGQKTSGEWTPSGVSRHPLVTTVSAPNPSQGLNGITSLNSSQIGQLNSGALVTSISTQPTSLGTYKTTSISGIYDFKQPTIQSSIIQSGILTERKDPTLDILQIGRKSSEKDKSPVDFPPKRTDIPQQRDEEKKPQPSQTLIQSSYTLPPSYKTTVIGQPSSKDSNSFGSQLLSGQISAQISPVTSMGGVSQLSGNYQATTYTSPGQVITGNTQNTINGGLVSNLSKLLSSRPDPFQDPRNKRHAKDRSLLG